MGLREAVQLLKVWVWTVVYAACATLIRCEASFKAALQGACLLFWNTCNVWGSP